MPLNVRHWALSCPLHQGCIENSSSNTTLIGSLSMGSGSKSAAYISPMTLLSAIMPGWNSSWHESHPVNPTLHTLPTRKAYTLGLLALHLLASLILIVQLNSPYLPFFSVCHMTTMFVKPSPHNQTSLCSKQVMQWFVLTWV